VVSWQAGTAQRSRWGCGCEVLPGSDCNSPVPYVMHVCMILYPTPVVQAVLLPLVFMSIALAPCHMQSCFSAQVWHQAGHCTMYIALAV
jgi:hypothetical protein